LYEIFAPGRLLAISDEYCPMAGVGDTGKGRIWRTKPCTACPDAHAGSVMMAGHHFSRKSTIGFLRTRR